VWEYRAQLVEVLDGDTVRLLADVGFYGRHQVDVRLLAVNAPELNEPGGRETADFVRNWTNGLAALRWPILLRTQTTKVSEPSEKQTFTRYIGDVYDITGAGYLNALVREFLAQHPEWGTGL
jgi:endonuclease YncB( thermonuclease family)